LSQLSNKIRISAFGLLELEIWAAEQYLGCRIDSDFFVVATI